MPKPLASCPIYAGDKFTWSGSDGSVDVSDLLCGREQFHTRVWADACDSGFVVRSHRTGRCVVFTYSHFDEEANTWRFDGRTHDGREITITIHND